MNIDLNDLLRYIKQYPLEFNNSDNDVTKSLTNQIANRDRYYTLLLKNHISLTKIRGICKEIHKWIFFWVILCFSIIGIVYIIKFFNRIYSTNDVNNIIDSIPAIITAFVSLFGAIIVVPKTIASFLFNTTEDDNITTLIQHTQDHDATSINFFKDRFIKKEDNISKDSNMELQYMHHD